MPNPQSPPSAESTLKSSRLISLALLGGVALFSAVAAVLVSQGTMGSGASEEAPLGPIFAGVLGLMAVGNAIGYRLVRSARVAALHRDGEHASDDDRAQGALQAYQQLHIIGSALAEAIGLFGAVVTLVTGNLLFLMAPAGTVCVLLWIFPSQQRIEDFHREVTEVS